MLDLKFFHKFVCNIILENQVIISFYVLFMKMNYCCGYFMKIQTTSQTDFLVRLISIVN